MTYKHGVYGFQADSVAASGVQASTTAVYIGTAPIHMNPDWESSDLINRPIKITGFDQAARVLGYSDNWNDYSLCEAMTAHFKNAKGNIGPIYVINVLDPDLCNDVGEKTVSLALNAKKEAVLSDDPIENVDFASITATGLQKKEFDAAKKQIKLTFAPETTSPVSVSYMPIDPEYVRESDVIGGVDSNGKTKGIAAVSQVYPQYFTPPNLLLAPGWSHSAAVYNELVARAQKINGHWEAFVLADLFDFDETGLNTIESAIAKKAESGFNSERSKIFWPLALDGVGHAYHLSTLAAVELMRQDQLNRGVPFKTCSNQSVPMTRQFYKANDTSEPFAAFDQMQANELNAAGISTMAPWAGQMLLWGGHTAAYQYGGTVDPRAIFDTSVRMLFYILQSFQQEWAVSVDQPMDLQLRDRILAREQEKLDALVAQGALIGSPKIVFLQENNPDTDIRNGDFRFDIQVTATPQAKSLSAWIAYTDAGFSVYYEEG